ncbi:MAG: trimethylamine methyltransferase family protein [Candidatus Bathyarchaeota archaeon]|nr:MAG: trimethylamine methyltransferase family protein [Candidatus Bathyarchaeota archaeon]
MVGFEKPSKMPSFRIFNKDDLYAIHGASLEVLSRTGIKIAHGENLLKALKKKGCDIDLKKGTVRFPSYLVEEGLKKVSKRAIIYARNPKYDCRLDGRHIYFSTGTETTNTVDLEDGEWKPSTKNDLEKLTRLINALESVNLVGTITTSLDKPDNVRCLHDYEAVLNNTEKPCGFNLYPPELAWYLLDRLIEMTVAVAGSEKKLKQRPLIGGFFCTESPLQLEGVFVETTLKLANMGFGCGIASMPMGGATAPSTLAGTLLMANAEMLCGICTVQLLCPGTPISCTYLPASLDMRYGTTGYGPEAMLQAAAAVEIAHYYGLPVHVFGAACMANLIGVQSGIESTMSGILSVLAGADILYGLGDLGDGMAASFERLVIDDELCKSFPFLAQGVEVSDETLALDIIHKVGPGGEYVSQKHTLEHFRKEYFYPELADTRNYAAWKKAGAKTLGEKAREKAKEILKEHCPTPLDKDVQKEISNIIEKAEKELSKKNIPEQT